VKGCGIVGTGACILVIEAVELVAKGQRPYVGFRLSHLIRVAAQLHPPRSQRVFEMEVQGWSLYALCVGGQVVGPHQLARCVNIGSLPVVIAVEHREFLARGAEDVVLRNSKAVLGWIAGERLRRKALVGRDRPLCYAGSFRVIDVSGGRHAASGRVALHRADPTLAVVRIVVGAIVGHVAGQVVPKAVGSRVLHPGDFIVGAFFGSLTSR